MDIHHPELTAAAIVAMAAMLCGGLMARLRQPAIVGYILAGVALGPSGLGLANNREAISVLAEFGVLMLLFVVGMRLDLRRFMAVWKTALFVTVLQIAGSVGTALLLRHVMGWSLGMAVVLGCAVAISSTAVVIKVLESSDELDTPVGRTTVAILIAQDMAVVPMILTLEAMETRSFEAMDAGRVVLSMALLALLFAVLSRRRLHLPLTSRLVHDVDLSTLAALTWCFGAAALSGLLNLSPAYGAFLGGIILGNTAESEVLLKRAQPVKSVLLMVFFLSIGLLLDFGFIWRNLGSVLLLLLMVTVFKTGLNIAALRLLRQDWPSAFLAGVALAQIGEFSFLLAETGKAGRLITTQETKLVVAVTVLSLVLSPFWLFTMRRMHGLAASQIHSFRELMNGLYGREANALARAARRARLLARRRGGDA
ncbi:ferrous iron transporter [Paramagnetospirillum marisnigri]|uniref:Ferrous iron transporter n=1 Tax=Paramagnetospirillum marisnigri TaxID=1285242 RepID=A0A178MTH2_9PROT|nr:cation:proton antiporter [Paramagnetospirillum marisnigri]OAN52157.1 ferrous iron transporter [Paramagnetospirillum marisnigri]